MIGATQSNDPVPEAKQASHERALGADDSWVQAARLAQEERKDQDNGEPDLGDLLPRDRGNGDDHGNNRSQEAREKAREKEGRENGQGDERNDNEKVTLCHGTGSSRNPGVTITVSENALDAHKRHGDDLGPCQSSMREQARGNRDSRAEGRGRGRDSSSGTEQGRQGEHGPPDGVLGR